MDKYIIIVKFFIIFINFKRTTKMFGSRPCFIIDKIKRNSLHKGKSSKQSHRGVRLYKILI